MESSPSPDHNNEVEFSNAEKRRAGLEKVRVHDSQVPKLSQEISALIELFAERSLTLRELMAVLKGRGFTLLLFLLALPFCTPIPMPGVSGPFGLAIAVIGFRLALGQKPWLPRRVLETHLPPRFFSKLLGATRRLVRALEYILRPRFSFLVEARALGHVCGAVIFVCGLLMVLPLPIPLSNGFPALTVVLISCAWLERDGYALVAGFLLFALTLSYFAFLLWGGAEITVWLKELIGARSANP